MGMSWYVLESYAHALHNPEQFELKKEGILYIYIYTLSIFKPAKVLMQHASSQDPHHDAGRASQWEDWVESTSTFQVKNVKNVRNDAKCKGN